MKRLRKFSLITILFVLACLCMFSSFAIGCSNDCSNDDEEVTIEIQSEAFRETVVLNQEFDVLSVIENYDESLTYEIKELFYLDIDFERHDIEFSGTKFTYSEPYKIYVTLVVKDDGKVIAEKEFTLSYEILSNKISNVFVDSWSDPGVTKVFESRTEYLGAGANHGVRVTYNGSYNPIGDGVNPGSAFQDSLSEYSVTDWSNAVITMDVYNMQNYEIQFGISFLKSNKLWTNGDFDTSFYVFSEKLKPNSLNKISWSLRSLNIQDNFLDAEVDIMFKMRIVDTTAAELVAPYSYKLVFSNIDITNYSAEKFPNLDTRTKSEIFDQLPGERYDKLLLSNIETDGTKQYQYAKALVSPTVIEYEGGGLAKPENLTTTSYIEYVVTAKEAMASGNYYGYAFNFSNVGDGRRQPLGEELKSAFSDVSDWSMSRLGFWIYNDGDMPLTLQSSPSHLWTAAKQTFTIDVDSWQYVEFDLGRFNYTENPFDGNYQLKIIFGYIGTGITDTSLSQKFYIDGLDFYSVSVNQLLSDNVIEKADEWQKGSGFHGNQNYKGHLDVTVEEYSNSFTAPTELATSPDYLKYKLTNPEKVGSGNYYGYLLAFVNSNYVTASDQRPIDTQIVNVNDWTRAKVSFYIKYNDATPIKLYVGSGSLVPSAYQTVNASNDWQKITFDLSGKYTNNPFANSTYDLRLYYCYNKGVIDANTINVDICIDGFNIYNEEQVVSNVDTIDNLLSNNVMLNGTDGYQYAVGQTNLHIREYTGSSLTKPSGLTTNSYLEYAVTASAASGSKSYYNYAFDFANSGDSRVKHPVSSDLKAQFDGVTDWATAKISFYVYYNGNYNLQFFASKNHLWNESGVDKQATTITKGSWQEVTFDLSSFGYTGNPFETGQNYNLKIIFGFISTGVDYANFSDVFYIDGFRIYNV